jgi:pimeloyl-ACP methyl ester carboxylesterase
VRISAHGIEIEVDDSGDSARPAVLLIMGLGMQLIAWPADLVDALVGAGFRVIRFDNRDIGWSRHFDELGIPNMVWESMKHRFGLPVRAPYTLQAMAQDSLGVLDALGIERAHVVGASMGGMIAQRVALTAPERVLSLTCIMSSSGARYLPGPSSRILAALMSRPHGRSEQALADHGVKIWRLIGSPAFPTDEATLRANVIAANRRSFHPAGTMRQMAAVAADWRRADELHRIVAPTLVVHGRDDPLVPVVCGHDTARRIVGSRFVAIPGMGHDLPPAVVERLLDVLLPHLKGACAP